MYVSELTWEFLTECTYGDRYRTLEQLPDKYRWLKSLMRAEGNKIADELSDKGLAKVATDGTVLINMSKLPALNILLDRLERKN